MISAIAASLAPPSVCSWGIASFWRPDLSLGAIGPRLYMKSKQASDSDA